MIEVSVIIPVYNAGKYVSDAVNSALSQPETKEVILIEDCSSDSSLEVCENISSTYDNVLLIRNRKNLGAGESRNVGIRAAKSEFIAFVDADDFYLPNRFREAKRVFENNAQCDGVYEPISMYIQDQKGWDKWVESGKKQQKLHFLKKAVSPEKLGEALLYGTDGGFSIDGLVIKKKAIERVAFFPKKIVLHEDTCFLIKHGFKSTLLPGRTNEPVASWRVHQGNRISVKIDETKKSLNHCKLYRELFLWARYQLDQTERTKIIKMLESEFLNYINLSTRKKPSLRNSIYFFMRFAIYCPKLVLERRFWRFAANNLTKNIFAQFEN